MVGGPLIVAGEDSTQDIQIGVVSWSMPAGCATKVFPIVSLMQTSNCALVDNSCSISVKW